VKTVTRQELTHWSISTQGIGVWLDLCIISLTWHVRLVYINSVVDMSAFSHHMYSSCFSLRMLYSLLLSVCLCCNCITAIRVYRETNIYNMFYERYNSYGRPVETFCLSTTNIISTSVNLILDILKDCRRSLFTYSSDVLQHVFVQYMHTYSI